MQIHHHNKQLFNALHELDACLTHYLNDNAIAQQQLRTFHQIHDNLYQTIKCIDQYLHETSTVIRVTHIHALNDIESCIRDATRVVTICSKQLHEIDVARYQTTRVANFAIRQLQLIDEAKEPITPVEARALALALPAAVEQHPRPKPGR